MALSPTKMFRYTVTYTLPGDITSSSRTMAAAYFTEDGNLTIFKDADHQAVFAVRTETLASVQRGPEA